ncbi:MAG: hypothetical protein AB1714_21485 [Acidobacteriota bacterium]
MVIRAGSVGLAIPLIIALFARILGGLWAVDMQYFSATATTIRITAADRVNGARARCQAAIRGAISWPAPPVVGRPPVDEPMSASRSQTQSEEQGPELIELLEKAVRLVEE